MNEYIELEYYRLGIALGIIPFEEFCDLVDKTITECDPIPDPFLELFSAVEKGTAACINVIDAYFAEKRHVPSYSVFPYDDNISRMLIKHIETDYRKGSLTVARCNELFSNLPFSLDEMCYLDAMLFDNSDDERVNEFLEDIFAYGIEKSPD